MTSRPEHADETEMTPPDHGKNRRYTAVTPAFDVQGHRGCRGLFPENSVPGFLHALDLGVNTLEMDVVLTEDLRVVVNHDPFVSPLLCRYPDGSPIQSQDDVRVFATPFHRLRTFRCGALPHPDFPRQRKVETHIPALEEVIEAAENHASKRGLPPPRYSIETKSTPEGDHHLHPPPQEFAASLAHVLTSAGVVERCIVQSFDVRTLQALRKPGFRGRYSLLVEDQEPPDEHLRSLGFTPDIYSPLHDLVDAALVDFCLRCGMKLIPWTVNDVARMENLILLGVDGLITDYPDLLKRFPREGEGGGE